MDRFRDQRGRAGIPMARFHAGRGPKHQGVLKFGRAPLPRRWASARLQDGTYQAGSRSLDSTIASLFGRPETHRGANIEEHLRGKTVFLMIQGPPRPPKLENPKLGTNLRESTINRGVIVGHRPRFRRVGCLGISHPLHHVQSKPSSTSRRLRSTIKLHPHRNPPASMRFLASRARSTSWDM